MREISIRSTEVETSDRAHVVVPNSYFITEKVKNWTHRNSLRRMAIPVTVDCSADPREVKAILLKVAQDNSNVVPAPAPSVALEDFGDSLNFKLYVFYDVDKDVGTDLRIAILDALHEAGVRKMAYLAKREPSESCRFDDRGKVDGAAPRLLRGQGSGAYVGSRAT